MLQVRQGPRFSIRMVIGIFCSDTVFVQLNQFSQILSRQCCLAVFIHISWFSGIILNTHTRIHATVAGQIYHHGRFEDIIFNSMQISWFEITRTLVGPYFNSQPLQCRHLPKHVRFSFHWRVKVAVCV